MKKVAKYWAPLPLKYKAAAIVVVAICAYLLYRKFLKKSEADKIAEQLSDSVNSTPVNKSNLTLTDNDLNVMAAQLYKAMKGAGTDTDTVSNVLSRVKTKDDLNALIRAYGIKDGEDLRLWLKGDLGGKNLEAVINLFTDLGVVF